jgi:hypothetical protein
MPVKRHPILSAITSHINQFGFDAGDSGTDLKIEQRGKFSIMRHHHRKNKTGCKMKVSISTKTAIHSLAHSLVIPQLTHTHIHTHSNDEAENLPAYWPSFHFNEKVLFHFAIDVLHSNS